MSARDRFVASARECLGCPVCWGKRGPGAFDCSGLVAWALKQAGGRDLTLTHNAQLMFRETPQVGMPLPGDLAFYGFGPHSVEHVAVWVSPEEVISADGATSHVTDLALAQANPNARVRTHTTVHFRKDLIGIHRNMYVDSVDLICT